MVCGWKMGKQKKSPLIWDVHNSLAEFTWPSSKDNVPRNFLRVM